jgi:hypothetical protein
MLLYPMVLGAIGFLICRFAPFFRQKFMIGEATDKKGVLQITSRLRKLEEQLGLQRKMRK